MAPTAADVRDVVVEGESGLLAISPPWFKPRWEPSRRRLTWPNGAIATTYSADEPERLRGPQHDAAWVDEVGSWRRPETMDNLLLGLRLGSNPRMCVTTTPRPTRLVKQLLASPTTAKTGGSTYDNRANLASEFIEQIASKYEGTRLGRQELYAEVLEVLDGVWFSSFDRQRHVTEAAEYNPLFPAYLAIDAGTSRHTGGVFYQVREMGRNRWTVNVFGDYYAVDKYSEANAAALYDVAMGFCGGQLAKVVLDPAASARTGVGPAAFAEYQRIFGPRTTYWPQHQVADGLDQIELLLGSETKESDLLIHPRCQHLIDAFNGYVRAKVRGEWMSWPEDPQHPHEDMLDALRGGIRDALPEGRRAQPAYSRAKAGRVF